MSPICFRRFISSSLALAFVIHTCRAHGATFPTTLTTTALDRSSSGWFAAPACTATAEGHQTTRSGSSISRTAPHPAAWSSTSSLLQRSCSHLPARSESAGGVASQRDACERESGSGHGRSGESPGELHPGGRRAGREPLTSSGSYRPACGARAEPPVGEQAGLAVRGRLYFQQAQRIRYSLIRLMSLTNSER